MELTIRKIDQIRAGRLILASIMADKEATIKVLDEVNEANAQGTSDCLLLTLALSDYCATVAAMVSADAEADLLAAMADTAKQEDQS